MIMHRKPHQASNTGSREQVRRGSAVCTLVLVWLAGPGHLVAADGPLPDAATILDRYVEVTGGKAAYAKVENRVSKGRLVFQGMDFEAAAVLYQARPTRQYFTSDSDALGKIEYGTDGKTAWYVSTQTGALIEDGEARAAIMRDYAFDGTVQWRELYKKAECIGEETVEGGPCYKVVLTPDSGLPETRYYARQSGLLIKTERTRLSSGMPPVPMEFYFGDYKRVDGLLLPHTRKQVSKQCGTTREILWVADSIEHNAALPANRFDLPEEVEARLKSGTAPAAATAVPCATAGAHEDGHGSPGDTRQQGSKQP